MILADGTCDKLPFASDAETWYVPSMHRTSDGAISAAVVSERSANQDIYVAKQNVISVNLFIMMYIHVHLYIYTSTCTCK